ncbi:syntaxin-71-like [Capsicum annuum]|uniref:syntaxin-71-like n=1 Tax=Capsicum annuum TaxID=4072 RepID=UPI001FB11369|nr:syntaxin-71-like [Capsicum annuum]
MKFFNMKVKGLSKEELETCGELVLMPSERIQTIPDRSTTDTTKKPRGRGTSSFNKNIKFDSEGQFDDGYYEQTDEAIHFRLEYEMRKMKQDEGLNVISEGLDILKNLAHDMNEELDRQVSLIDEIDTKVDKASRQLASDIKNNNVKLKKNINKVWSSSSFCIDIILICILLGIAAYLYNFVISSLMIVKLLAFVYCVVCSVADKMEAVIVTTPLGSSDASSEDQELDINRM